MKGKIKPVYADINEKNLELVANLSEVFKSHIGKKKGDLLERVSEYELKGFDYRFIRGLSLILQRRCEFLVETVVDPFLARRLLFEEANRMSFVPTDKVREEVFKSVAGKLSVTEEDLEKSFYADLHTELILKEIKPISPSEALKQYNLALTQTLLFKAVFLEVKMSGYWKEVLRGIKFRGLMYSAESRNGVFLITVDGPSSLFKLTQRYGTNMAKTLPIIVQAEEWEINGSVVRTSQFGKRILQLELSSKKVKDIITPSILQREDERVAFDSLVEEKFFHDFKSLHSGWKIIREPSPLIVGKHVFIPDFRFEKNSVKVYMEIVGFWTKKYLENKIKKLGQLKNVDIIIAVNERLKCDKIKSVMGEVIFYKKNVPLNPIIKILKEREEILLKQEIQVVDLAKLHLEGDIVELRKLAKEYGVSNEAIKRKLEGFKPKDYTLSGEVFISNKKLQKIDLRISTLDNPSLAHAISIIEKEGLKKPYDILLTLHYGIRWKGLDSENTSIYKKKMKRSLN